MFVLIETLSLARSLSAKNWLTRATAGEGERLRAARGAKPGAVAAAEDGSGARVAQPQHEPGRAGEGAVGVSESVERARASEERRGESVVPRELLRVR